MMQIFDMKLQKKDIPFTMVANEVLRSTKISLKAKGMYSYLFSKPDGWEFSADRIKKEGNDGRHSVQSSLKELEETGYLERKKLPTGKVDYILKYSTQSQETELRVEEAKVGFSHSGETDLISNKDTKSNKEIAAASAAPFDWTKYLDGMFESNQVHLNVIALFFREKGIKFANPKEASAAIARHARAAKEVAKFEDEKVLRAVKMAKEEYPKIFTVETILKMLTR